MRKKIYIVCLLSLACLCEGVVWSQCTPGDAVSCPDPENNGQICPDSLPGGVAGKLYSQSFTILAPPAYPVNENDTVLLHHITLKDVSNLPPGFTWQSNDPANEFKVGTYYCVLLEGTSPVAGKYDLKITVDVYGVVFDTIPIFLKTITDSTSLFLEIIWDPNATDGHDMDRFELLEPRPNPFTHHTRIEFRLNEPGMVKLEVYDLVGQLCYMENITAGAGENAFQFNGSQLKEGMYILLISNDFTSFATRLIKTE